MNQHVVTLTDANWKQEVSEATVPVLVDFWAEWCAPCRMMSPAIDAVAAAYAGRVKVGKLNVDDNPEVAGSFEIRSIPTLLVFKNGKVVDQQIGAVPQARLASMLDGQLERLEAGARRA